MRNKKLYTEHTYEAEIVIGEHIIKASAFLDTGNRLKDPLTGKPVAVASERFWNRLAEEMLQEDGADDELYFFKSKSSIDYRYDIKG